jgi:GNAT acetyltransferase
MIPLDKSSTRSLQRFYQDYKWNYLPDAILEGTVGEALVDDEGDPQVAVLQIPKLKLSIPGGDARHPAAREFVEKLPRFSALICASQEWEELLQEVHAGKLIGMQRYAFTGEKLDIDHLRGLASRIPDGCRLARIDLSLAKQLAAERSEFASAHMRNFDSAEDFIARGFGFCVLAGDEIVSAATTFAVCNKGIEIEVGTREKQRGRGLATVVSAQLLVQSLEQGLDPHWDAENERSVGLANKLGYTPQGTYYLWLFAGGKLAAGSVKALLRIQSFFGR